MPAAVSVEGAVRAVPVSVTDDGLVPEIELSGADVAVVVDGDDLSRGVECALEFVQRRDGRVRIGGMELAVRLGILLTTAVLEVPRSSFPPAL